jgi:transposase InsO family protein
VLEYLRLLIATLLALLLPRLDLATENLLLRQQIAVLQRSVKRPRLRPIDRFVWALAARHFGGWQDALAIVKPTTVISWHRKGFRLFWTWNSRRRRPGRPKIPARVRKLIRTMALANVGWGPPRIHGELMKLGIAVSEATVSRYMPRRPRTPPSQSWRTFLRNHARELVAIDFFVVPTVTFKLLFGFVVLDHGRRRLVHVGATGHPTAEWTAQQLIEAFPWETAPRYLLRDRDRIYGAAFRQRVKGMGIREVLIAPRSPWQNPFAERVIGSIRRELLDHVIVLGERHLQKLLRRYADYYNGSRTHLSLEKDAPEHRETAGPDQGEVVAFPKLGGLHHLCTREAA